MSVIIIILFLYEEGVAVKKLLKSAAAAGALLFACLPLCGCSEEAAPIVLEKSRVPVGYTATYHITVKDGIAEGEDLTYDNRYSIYAEGEDGSRQLVISSIAEAPYTNEKEEEGIQTITASSRLVYDDTTLAGFGTPVTVEEEFTNTVAQTQYTHLLAEHDHSLKMALLKTKKYKSSTDTEPTESLYSVSLQTQYFDKDSLPFLLAAFPSGQDAVIWLSAGNRDRLQAVKYEPLGNEHVTVPAGAFNCMKIRIRPNTDFSVYSATIYLDSATGLVVKIIQQNSVMELMETDLPTDISA